MTTDKDPPNDEVRVKAKTPDPAPMHTLMIAGTTFHTTLTRKFLARKHYAPPNLREVRAFIPGVILKIHCKPGSVVRKGDSLLALEAMKMQNEIVSPVDGTIKRIAVTVGRQVPKGELLVEIS